MPGRKIATPTETFDEPWKQIVPALFEAFLTFFAPAMAEKIDWRHKPEFLDKELRRIAKGFGRRRRSTADFLVKVWLLDGEEKWLIIHIELQAQKDTNFPERMFLYNVRAFDLYRQPVIGMAILADGDPHWRPDRFGYGMGTSTTGHQYSVVKLLDYQDRQQGLEGMANPFGLAVLAHLKTQETRDDAESRLQWKLRLARMLFDRRWNRAQIEELFQFIDWIMTLPETLENRFEADYKEMENRDTMAERMPPLYRRERVRGEISEAKSLLLRLGHKRLGPPDETVVARIDAIQKRQRLEELFDRALDVETWAELFESDS